MIKDFRLQGLKTFDIKGLISNGCEDPIRIFISKLQVVLRMDQ